MGQHEQPASAASQPLKRLEDFSLMDLRSIWLLLQGSSVIDWTRLDFTSEQEVNTFIASHGFDVSQANDRRRIAQIKGAAIDYLRRQFNFPIPRPVEQASVVELLLIASGKGHRQLCACIILKAMHIIHHVEARELQYSLALSDQEMFSMVEERVYRLVGHMLADGLPITEFVGGRKRRDSIYTKLLSKREAHASAVYDKQRFRIVTRTKEDILPVVLYLSQHLLPFNYLVPTESVNTIFQLRHHFKKHPQYATLVNRVEGAGGLDAVTMTDNLFSAESYRIIHFVADLPVRTPEPLSAKAPAHVQPLGPIIFGLCEFQMVDRQTEEANEKGEASHASYKERQRRAVRDRLRIGHASRHGKKKSK